MHIEKTELRGVCVITPVKLPDERGYFARTFCADEFRVEGLVCEFVQCSVSHNNCTGTLRGMHYQAAPREETKLISCTAGRIFDVALDLRPDSPTFRRWFAAVLTPENRKMLYVPEGCAHGFQAMEDDTDVFYQISVAYSPNHSRGVRWDDPAFGIEWPLANPIISERDCAFSDFRPDKQA